MPLPPNLPISGLPDAGALDGSELVAIVQDGVTRKTASVNFNGITEGFSFGLSGFTPSADNAWEDYAGITVPASSNLLIDLFCTGSITVSGGHAWTSIQIFDLTNGMQIQGAFSIAAYGKFVLVNTQRGTGVISVLVKNPDPTDLELMIRCGRFTDDMAATIGGGGLISDGVRGQCTLRTIRKL